MMSGLNHSTPPDQPERFHSPDKNTCLSKNSAQFYSLLSDHICDIDMRKLGLLHRNNLKPVLAQLKKRNPALCTLTAYKIKYFPFNYYMHYEIIGYAWSERYLGPYTYDHDCKWDVPHTIKHNPV